MGTYTHVIINKQTVPPSKYDELVEFLEEEMMHEGAGIDTNGYFVSFSGRKWGRNANNQKTKLAQKLDQIYEETKRKHWGSKDPRVLTRFSQTDKFLEWDWRSEITDSQP